MGFFKGEFIEIGIGEVYNPSTVESLAYKSYDASKAFAQGCLGLAGILSESAIDKVMPYYNKAVKEVASCGPRFIALPSRQSSQRG